MNDPYEIIEQHDDISKQQYNLYFNELNNCNHKIIPFIKENNKLWILHNNEYIQININTIENINSYFDFNIYYPVMILVDEYKFWRIIDDNILDNTFDNTFDKININSCHDNDKKIYLQLMIYKKKYTMNNIHEYINYDFINCNYDIINDNENIKKEIKNNNKINIVYKKFINNISNLNKIIINSFNTS